MQALKMPQCVWGGRCGCVWVWVCVCLCMCVCNVQTVHSQLEGFPLLSHIVTNIDAVSIVKDSDAPTKTLSSFTLEC